AQTGAIAPQIPALNVPILTAATDDSLLINDVTGQLFRARASNFFTERALADYLLNNARVANLDVIQFDIDATISVLGFTSAYQAVGGTPTTPVLVNTPDILNSTIEDILSRNPPGVVTYGSPASAGNFYVQLRNAGYAGVFAHPQANTSAFRGEFPPQITAGIISSSTWTPGAADPTSTNFLASYVRTYGEIPDAVAAAGADAITLLAAAIGLPGELRANLTTLQGLSGIQGTLAPAGRTTGELSDNTFVVQLNEFGAPIVQERFSGTTRVPVEDAPDVEDALLPTATPLPDGVFVRIISEVQNVRSGPSTNFETLGQLEQDETIEVIGANTALTWLVIEFRGQQGWVANLDTLNEVIGDTNTLPIVTPPATPTPPPLPTPLPVTEPDIIIQSAQISPNPANSSETFTLTVTVANSGGSSSGPFTVNTTLPPDNLFLSASVGGLAPGQSTTVNLQGTLTGTGNFSAIIFADANNEVAEGAGENNNSTFNFSYQVTGSGEADSGSGSGDNVQIEDGNTFTLNLETNIRIRWTGDVFQAVDSQIGEISGTFSDIDEDDITSSNANTNEIDPDEGDLIVILADDGDKAVIRVEELQDDGDVIIDYRTFD
ncbi:MAG: CARDB domain-containing protein, partial [Chloroflexota bacterium]